MSTQKSETRTHTHTVLAERVVKILKVSIYETHLYQPGCPEMQEKVDSMDVAQHRRVLDQGGLENAVPASRHDPA